MSLLLSELFGAKVDDSGSSFHVSRFPKSLARLKRVKSMLRGKAGVVLRLPSVLHLFLSNVY